MELYVLRHGLAADKSDARYLNDRDRPLTLEGRKTTRALARRLRTLKWSFDLILTSPLIRARQTAELTASPLRSKSKLHVTEHLAPEGEMAALIREINSARPRAESILLVGHEPYLSELISILLSGEFNLPIRLKKGGICKLEIDSLKLGRCAELQLLASPKFML